jgi:hypothetical protein
MPEYNLSGHIYVLNRIPIEHTFIADGIDDAYDVAYDYCVGIAEDEGNTLDDTDYIVTPVAPPAPARERLIITRPDGSTYTCYGTFEDVQQATVPEPIPTVRGTRVTDPITLPNGNEYRPYGAVERAP